MAKILAPLKQSGRIFDQQELDYILWIVNRYSGLSRTELAGTVCEHFNWLTASSQTKGHACMKLFLQLEALGVKFPATNNKKRRSHKPKITPQTNAPVKPIQCRFSQLGEVRLELINDKNDKLLFNEFIERYHFLGYKKPFGNVLRYFIKANEHILGCILIAGASRAIKSRDQWLGWDADCRRENISWIVNNTRYLIFPWMRVPHLASFGLGQLARRVGEDYKYHWNYEPVLLETFVDSSKHEGTCYKASNWIELGTTTGKGLARIGKTYNTTAKKIFVYPLKKLKTVKEKLNNPTLMSQKRGEYAFI